MDERDAEERRADLLQQAAAGTAHDVNNLLLIVNACAAMALEDRTLGPDARELVREILEAGERATSLARQFLALGRPSEPPAIVDVAGLVQSSETLLRRVLGPGITLVLVTGRTPLPVRAHASQLEQVILNLVLNACNAMPDGGTLTIACAPAVDEQRGRQPCGAGAACRTPAL